MVKHKRSAHRDNNITRARAHAIIIFLSATLASVVGPNSTALAADKKFTHSPDSIRTQKASENKALRRYQLNKELLKSSVSGVEHDLISSLQSDPDLVVRQGAAQALGKYVQNETVVRSLVNHLKTETEPAVRYACVQSLSLSNNFRAMNTLEKFADDPDPAMRRLVAFNLRNKPGLRSKMLLKKLAKDADQNVRDLAGEVQP